MYRRRSKTSRKLYELARAGEEVERKRRASLFTFEPNDDWRVLKNNPDGTYDLPVRRCSSGTYIRNFSEEFGNGLGVGAPLSGELRRTRVGIFTWNTARTLTG